MNSLNHYLKAVRDKDEDVYKIEDALNYQQSVNGSSVTGY